MTYQTAGSWNSSIVVALIHVCYDPMIVMALTVVGMTTGDTSIDLAESVSYLEFFSGYGA